MLWPSTELPCGVERLKFSALKQSQDLLRRRLNGPLLRLVPQLTGLRLNILWHGLLDFRECGPISVLCPTAQRRLNAKRRQPDRCGSCLRELWKSGISPPNRGWRFIGKCGAVNFCAGLQVDEIRLLTLVLQARVTRRFSSSANSGRNKSAPLRVRADGSVSASTFHDAVALVRLILHDLESTAQAQMTGSKLENALRRLNRAEKEALRLQGNLRHRLPSLPESSLEPAVGSQGEKHVRQMLDYVQQHGHRPINLNELAQAMKLNASYLSALFSEMTGVPFHQFLKEVRLAKAKDLLRDPRNRVCEVACATGYASADAFRHAFKAQEGVSPEAWRSGQ